MASDQNIAVTPDQAMISNNLTSGTSLVTTTQSPPAVTRSLDLEFEAEGPPPGFGSITTVSSQTVVTDPFLYLPSQLQSRGPGGTSGNMFTPATTTGAQSSRLGSIPLITWANPSTIIPQTSMPQYYQLLVTSSMPPLYSAALTAALSTPPHQPVIMPAGIMNAPVTPGNQVYFPGYCYAPPYGYLPSYGGSTYPPQGTTQGSTQSPYAAYMPPWWAFPASQPVYTQTPPTAELVYDRGNAVRPRVSPIGSSNPMPDIVLGIDTPPVQPINVEEDKLTRPYKPIDATFRSKFTRRIAEAPIKEKPKMPQTVGKYDGLGDPDDHLNLFKSAGEVACWSMPLWCKMFVQTLVGAARVWWDSLPTGEIDSFEDLESKFILQFSQQRRHTKDRNELLHIRRRDNETVENFIIRFNKESLAIPGVTNDLACGAFLQGVNDDELLRTLHGRDGVPPTIDEILRIAKVYVIQEKAVAASHAANRKKEALKNQEEREHRGSRGKGRGDRYQRNDKADTRYDRHRNSYSRSEPSKPRSEYPNLSKTPAEILASENFKFNPPKLLKDNPNKDTTKKQIEYFVKVGKLAHLVRDIKQGPPVVKEENDKAAGKRPQELNMVHADMGKGAKRSFSTLEPWMLATMTIEPRMEDLHLTTDALIISAAVGDYRMRRMLVDTGSSEDIIYEHCFNRMQPEDRKLLESVHAPIKGFTGEKVDPIGQITFPVTFGQELRERTILLTFLVVRAESYHNVIIGRFTLGKLDAIVSTARGFMKFPTPRGIATVFRDKIGEVLNTKRCRQGPTGATGPERWVLSTRHPDQMVTIGDTLSPEIKNDLKQLLRRNVDIFAFEHSDMTGVPRDKAEHKLATLPGIKPVAQGKRSMAPDRKATVVKEVRKLVEAGILRETQYHTWVANLVMVKKPDGTWRMCIDFKDLNKACPKDAYPLPEIDFKVDSLVPYRYKCFLDAYKGYHQIKMSKEDEEKTAFHTDVGIFYYTKMPFGLRNAGATYQRLMDKVFETQIGRNLEVYVDDLVIKSREEKQMLEDIEETFQRLREYNIKLNPKKCSFGVEEGKFLGVVVTRDGFKANPEKVAAIARMPSPRTLKEAQALNGRLVAINRFLARHAEKSLPFIKTLKDCLNKKNFKRTSEAEKVLQDMKRFIEGLPMLTAPRPNEVLKMYLAAAHTAVSVVLMVKRDGRQTPIYYISRVLAGPETRYPTLEKLVLALVHATR
ncbi:uncharacterized protein LOC110913490 [Helianthus annuus]|uniref:uncharacterized protein LOC110913490 n=1 Tax=Helianthus annuus TaxID=4232 RepID=UPI000B905B3C|nr:uncharacterized protein LOC110913490 [Helianthus annuus]